MKRQFLTAFAVFAAVCICTPCALAEEEEAAAPKRLLTIDAGVDFTNAYVYRGYVAQDRGLITQPRLTLELNVPQLQQGDCVVTPYIGIWGSTSCASDSPEEPRWLYEVDYFAGTRIECGNFTLDFYFQHNSYPGKVWHTTNELDLTLSYDDTHFTVEQLKLPVAVMPHITLARALDRSDNLDQGPDSYLELGIEPTYELELGKTAVTFSLPVNVGLGFHHYYRDENGGRELLGFVSAGLTVSVPLPVPEEFGEWELHAGVTWYRLNAESVLETNDGRADKVVGMIGVGVNY